MLTGLRFIGKCARLLLPAIDEIIKQRYAVGFGPNANLPRFFERVVVPFEPLLPIKSDNKMAALEIDSQCMPLLRGHFHFGSLLLCALAFDGVVNCDVIFKRIGASDVVIVRILAPPENAPSLVLLARDRLELHLDKTIFNAGIVLDAHGIGGFPGLFQHIRPARGRIVANDRPLSGALTGLCGRPTGRRSTGVKGVEVDGFAKCCPGGESARKYGGWHGSHLSYI